MQSEYQKKRETWREAARTVRLQPETRETIPLAGSPEVVKNPPWIMLAKVKVPGTGIYVPHSVTPAVLSDWSGGADSTRGYDAMGPCNPEGSAADVLTQLA